MQLLNYAYVGIAFLQRMGTREASRTPVHNNSNLLSFRRDSSGLWSCLTMRGIGSRLSQSTSNTLKREPQKRGHVIRTVDLLSFIAVTHHVICHQGRFFPDL